MHSLIDAQLLTLSKGKAPVDEPLDPGGMADRIPAIKSAIEKATPSSPSLFIFSVCGDTFRGDRSVAMSGKSRIDSHLIAELAPVEEYLGLNSRVHYLFDTLRPYQNYFTDYDSSLMHREAITFLVRTGPNRHVVTLALKIHLPSLSAVAIVAARDFDDLSILRRSFVAPINEPLLRASPLGILTLIFEQRSSHWEQWAFRLWRVINEIEGSRGLAPEEWVSSPITEERRRELEDVNMLQKKLSTIRVEINHGKGVVEGGMRLGRFCNEAISVVHGGECLLGTLMCGGLMPGERELLVERIRGPVARCAASLERFAEFEARHTGHLGHMESKTNRAVAEITLDVARLTASDSRTMKTIGVVEVVFLPAIFVSTVWGATGVVELDSATNKYVFVGVILALTVVVVGFWAMYMRHSRKYFGHDHGAALRAGLDIV
ncbi:hypothetical protein QBC34DRAFT_385083 [Podospora aff. communis PSN243]|uniref:Uncharacterized protein n=1 Tax=Podospora aff. communis PSN243 TaxID=3040156 RepID=A0AAV9G9A0_9PEZI|nr:hypothetical protein QBC34DRAFT_385083 [Podospora aff. communis PSN243]